MKINFEAMSFKEKIKLLPKKDLQDILRAIDLQSASDESEQPLLQLQDNLEKLTIK